MGGALLSSFVLSVNGKVPKEYIPILAPQNTVNTEGRNGFDEDFQAFWSQAFCTWIFVTVILMLKGPKTGPSKDGINVAIAVGLTLWALITVNSHMGACYNPAVALANTYFQMQYLDDSNSWLSHYFYAYTAGPALGGACAGLFYLLHQSFHSVQEESHRDSDQQSSAYDLHSDRGD